MRIGLTLLLSLVCISPLVQVQAEKTKIPGAQDVLAGTIGALETEGLLHADRVDTAKTSIEQRASQKVSNRRSRQIYFVQVILRDGAEIDAFAVRDNSPIAEESGLIVYLISKILQPDGQPVPAHLGQER
jgi:hypothetical protein